MNINIFKEKLFQPKGYTLNQFLTIKGEEELTEKHFISRNNELTDYNQLINKKNNNHNENFWLYFITKLISLNRSKCMLNSY